MPAALRTDSLSKRFGAIRAVEGISLSVEEGDIYGLLGPNGSGKTTTLRMILRLVQPDAGRVEIFGLDVRTSFLDAMKRTGTLIELPAYYPHLSAARNLRLLQRISGDDDPSRIDEVLTLVGLLPRRHSPVRTFSQGMKQRLAIAMALLSRPRLVILDEPTNALDPEGIAEIRELIRRLNRDEGITFLLSSHLLPEVEMICNRVGIIREGRLCEQGRIDELLARTSRPVRIECDRPDEALRLLQSLPWTREARRADRNLLVLLDSSDYARLNAELHRAGFSVSAFVPQRPTLEEFFLNRRGA